MENSIVRGDLQAKVRLMTNWRCSGAIQPGKTCYTATIQAKRLSWKILKKPHLCSQFIFTGIEVIRPAGAPFWMAPYRQKIFQKALEKNPNNDSSQIGWAAPIFSAAAEVHHKAFNASGRWPNAIR
jgi:hypothetical protein